MEIEQYIQIVTGQYTDVLNEIPEITADSQNRLIGELEKILRTNSKMLESNKIENINREYVSIGEIPEEV